MTKETSLIIPAERIQQCIYLIRKQKVMLDKDLAALYGVTTKRLNEQVQRNIDRFPSDFIFQLNNKEAKVLRSQFATSKKAVEAGDIIPMPLPSRVWQCFPACCGANALSRSISP